MARKDRDRHEDHDADDRKKKRRKPKPKPKHHKPPPKTPAPPTTTTEKLKASSKQSGPDAMQATPGFYPATQSGSGWTITGPIALGIMCFRMINRSGVPHDFAASI